MLAIALFRCVTWELNAGLPMYWNRETLGLSDSCMIEPQKICHHVDVVRLVVVLALSVEVDQFPMQQPIEQFEILQTSLDIAVFPEPILSSADVVPRVFLILLLRSVFRV